MMPRPRAHVRGLLTAAAAVLAAGPAAAGPPAEPTPPTHCARFLALADAGASAGCDTIGSGPEEAGRPYRQVTVAVQSGAVHATVQCSEGEPAAIEVAAPFTRSAAVPSSAGDYCWITVTALFDGTTAAATSTWAWVVA